MKKILFTLFSFLFVLGAHSAQVANVEYIHNLVKNKWDITIPYSPDLVSEKQAANMEYLLTVVDIANRAINKKPVTNYGQSNFATRVVVDTIAVNQAVETLISRKYDFFMTVADTGSFYIDLDAAGEFYIDWGDGQTETIINTDVEYLTVEHNYAESGTYRIKMGGLATGYNDDEFRGSTVYFYTRGSITKLEGSIGAIFKTLPDGTQPSFSYTFSDMYELTSIPENLFAGISGAPAKSMFAYTFDGCEGLTSIPENLFAGISGAPAEGMFAYTFVGCSGLTGAIPSGLFAGISGAPAEGMFDSTFSGCSGLTSIPENLFAGISGAPAPYMFMYTFDACEGLTSIPENLFAGISGAPAEYMFENTFGNCSGLTGAIPDGLFVGISGAPAEGMFVFTFYGCSGLTSIPENLFGNISGPAQNYMFSNTFHGCTSLTGPSARIINGQYLYEIWPDATEDQVGDMYTGATGLSDYDEIPFIWGGNGVRPTFTLTTTPDTDSFSFVIGAGGTFHIDWGDGNKETINKSTGEKTYSHTYNTAGAYTIKLDGKATSYSSDDNVTAIRFNMSALSSDANVKKIASIDGSLGAIFGTLASGTTKQPRFYRTFYNASNMTGSIPENLFAGISGAPASYMFGYTFSGCSGLTGAIPENLFAGISGAPASHMFHGTFVLCSGLTGAIPENLFAGIFGAPAEGMFLSTFSGCSGLTGAIPENLFAGISDAPAEWMFFATFAACSGLTSIPAGLFAGISGAPAKSMFDQTFRECSGLTGAIPAGLFAGISGAPAEDMFYGTFYGCTSLTTIPENLFGNISGTAKSNMFASTFYNCTSLTGPSARINGQYLYEIWPDATSTQVGSMYSNATGLEDYRCIPTVWGGGGENCSAPTAEFTLTTTDDTDSFSFRISAAGEFVVDWGDGTVETITKPDTTNTRYSHNYSTAGAYTIGFSGQATAYTSTTTAAISFIDARGGDVNSTGQIASINGSLGAIFGTLPDATEKQPGFISTFHNASNMTGSIPSDLFAGISGAPADRMFAYTFYGCSGLTSIPAGLFAGISGAPASNMFYFTFSGCSGLTSIPAGLFAGISGAPAERMFGNTFSDCSGLTSIPENLFGGISGAPAESMFNGTFGGCSGLTSIPENLFGNISGTAKSNMFASTFYNCTSLTGPSARINGQYLYEIWPDATSTQVGSMYSNATGLEDYRCIPTVWGGSGENCSAPTAEFTLTTTDDTDSFSFSISAAGEFVVDWGDGTVETITKPDTTDTTYSHNYSTAGAYTIGLSGQATAYNTDEYTAAISFSINSSYAKIASIDGSLGAIFGTLPDATEKQPRFYRTFYRATNMKGAIPANLFAGISGAPASYMFFNTFFGCRGLTSIPSDLFAGISGAPASHMFDYTFANCRGLTSIPSDLFAGISGAPASYMFNGTFSRCTGLTSIPENLFAGISGAPAESMFSYTFEDCSGLTGAIPSGLFAGISGAPAESMFDSTFYYCSGLTSIPENLFGNISGTAQNYMFSNTFYDCTSLTGPSARINGQYLYEIWPDATSTQVGSMYSNATGLEDYRCIPSVWGGLGETCAPAPEFTLTTTDDTDSFEFSISAAGEFVVDWGDGTVETITKPDTTNTIYSHSYDTADTYTIGLSGQATAYNTDTSTAAISFVDAVDWEFDSTWHIASIDGSLGAIFGTLSSDTNNQPRFCRTFDSAYNMTGSIPENLFAGISGAPAINMFDSTFASCSGLTGAIPAGLFGNLTGAPAEGMFYNTFYHCSGLTSIPENLFGGISGAPASYMFAYTFEGCSGLTSIPENLFDGISGAPAESMFDGTFYNCTSLTGPSARINGQYLYEIWPGATSSQVGDMYYNATGLEDYRCIPSVWGGGGENCSAPAPEFTLTTTSSPRSFEFSISAAGEFVVDWGDGTVETITKPDTTKTIYSHNYSPAGAYTIGFSGQATAYNTDEYTAAISFYVNSSQTKIASIDGSLGAIFGTLSSDTNNQPRFYYTFNNAINMTGSIPSDLFTGISGAPASNMFSSTFQGCSGLTGAIPDGLFAGISGKPASNMFSSTFQGCSGLTSIPAGLFAGISGAPASNMFYFTFSGCSGLTGAIPDGLFAGISGNPANGMFQGTFNGCTGLTSIPENLFGNISGPAQSMMFFKTFYDCTSLTGPSARINGQYLYEIWSGTWFWYTYKYCTGLSDYASIPISWKDD